ncbi:MAG: ABC transporter ATP-binding protein [Treponema sp.]|nr:ABC transporter ATP-binding protein [Treponema sp.]
MAVNIIELQNIIKTYKVKKTKEPFCAVNNVSLSIKQGEIFGLLGSNGAGKTTLIKIMAGLLEPDSGRGTVLDYDIYRDHKIIRSKVSLVAPTADIGTDNNLTVRQNLEFWAVVYNLEKSQRKKRIDGMLLFLNLKKYENHWPMSISAGNRQKLAIARSLLVYNPILFLDEPTVKLDAAGAETVRGLVKKINAEFGTTIILTTHYIFEAEELCGRVAIMHKGKIKSCGTVENLRHDLKRYDELIVRGSGLDTFPAGALKAQPFVITADLQPAGNKSGALVIQAAELKTHLNFILKCLLDNGVQINSMETIEPTLEDIFMDAIGAASESGASVGGGISPGGGASCGGGA